MKESEEKDPTLDAFELDLLIELAVTGQASGVEFDQLMTRVENEPDVSELFRAASSRRALVESLVQGIELRHEITNSTEKSEATKEVDSQPSIEKDNDLELDR